MIQFTKEELDLTIEQQDLSYAVIGKFSYGWPAITQLKTLIPIQCELKGKVTIGLLCNRHVLIRWTVFEDYVKLLSKPMFWIKEKNFYYSMRTLKWNSWFNPEEETSIALAWISFPNLPPNWFGESTLFSLAAAAGKPLLIDAATRNKTRSSCARVKVERDLLKEHPQSAQIQVLDNGEVRTIKVRIQYDHMPKYCKECKLQGHDEKGCWKIHPELFLEVEKKRDAVQFFLSVLLNTVASHSVLEFLIF